MGFTALEGSWLEGQNALVSTAVGALTFWLLGAVVGLLVSTALVAIVRNARYRDRKRRGRFAVPGCCETTTAQKLCRCVQLPRPKWLATSSFLGPSAFYSPAGVLVRRLSLLFQGLYILR